MQINLAILWVPLLPSILCEQIHTMIDIFLFEQQFRRFQEHVIKESGLDFTSFSSNPYTAQEEDYKYDVYRTARKILKFETWREADIGAGDIARSVAEAIELPANNLVQWQSRYGDESRPHHALKSAIESLSDIETYDSAFYSLYRKSDDPNTFESFVKLFGRKYALIAYLLFLKDRTRYMPIAPSYFDQAFSLLGVDFSTNQKCSWENYLTFNNILLELKVLLSEKLEGEVSLLDAHSFAWMISRTIDDNVLSENDRKYLELSAKQREAVVQARIGQGYFRDELFKYWGVCSITGCQERSLLRASHIKPWSKCDLKEAIDPFNGLLLSPTFDAAFDAALITFDDAGKILISPSLRDSDAKALGIFTSLRLKQIDRRHQHYLHYHRDLFSVRANHSLEQADKRS